VHQRQQILGAVVKLAHEQADGLLCAFALTDIARDFRGTHVKLSL
jgi:hypothetical protein